MATPSLRTTTHLVAHALREIESAIRDVLLPHDYKAPKSAKGDTHRAEIDAILAAYGIPDSDPVAVGWRRLADQNYDFTLWRHAHRNALDRPRPLSEDFREFITEMDRIFDVLLGRFEERFLDPFSRLDALLAKTSPTAKDAELLRNRIPHNLVTLDHFFNRVENPAWLELLAAEGFFRHPPEPISDEEQGGVRLPPWPASRYLVRMAAIPKLQARVAAIALSVPPTTNAHVNENLADVAFALPAPLAVRFVEKAKVWLASPYRILLAEKLGALVGKLSTGGEVDAALELARALLVAPPHRDRTFDVWLYGQILKKHVPALLDAGGIRALALLTDALAAVDSASERYSNIWRPAIEDHPQNRERGQDPKDMLITAVRDAAENVARREPAQVPTIVHLLEQHPGHLFRRIALHVLRVFPSSARDLIVERLTTRPVFEEGDLWHEYFLLLRERFSDLAPGERDTVLGWIEDGPDLDRHGSWRERETGAAPTPEDLERHSQAWRLHRLAPLRDVLPPEWRARHDALATDLGEVEHPDLLSYSSGMWAGPTSPKSADELRQMTVADIVAYLRSWEPLRAFMVPSPEGLGRDLKSVVAGDPERFARDADLFHDLDPTYVRALFSGLRDAIKAERAFPWAPVLELCQWVVDQGPDTGGSRRPRPLDDDRDPSWGWARKAIADLLEAGFEKAPLKLPFELRQAAWAVLRPLTEDPDPTPEHEAEYGGSNMSPSDLSINTTRGDAMHAVEQYGLWVRRHLEELPDKVERIARGFDEMPEVREVLDRRLDISVEPSLTIRSVYGRHFPWLALLDRRWAETNVSRIFPQDPTLRRLCETAWDTYVTFCRPYNDVLPLLREEYLRAIDRIGSDRGTRHIADPDERLAEHLMVYYWLGKLDLDGPGLTRFFEKAQDALRGQAISFVGNAFHNTEETIPEDVLGRARALWSARFEIATRAPAAHAKELAAFGWWFATTHFDERWRIQQLLEVLALSGRAEPDHVVLEHLAELSSRLPCPTVQCLRLLIDGAKEPWTITAWHDQIRTVVANALGSTEQEARDGARAIVNVLAARGYPEFRDLLGNSPGN